MKTDIQTKLKTLFDEKIKNRKAMFIPIAGVAAFMLVGYAGVDHEKPEIVSSHIQIPYGEKLKCVQQISLIILMLKQFK